MSKLFTYLGWMLVAASCSDVLVGGFSHGGDTELDSADTTTGTLSTGTGDSDANPGGDAGNGEDSETDTVEVSVSASLVHRWRFDENFNDEAGGSNAEVMEPVDTVVGNVSLSSGQVHFEGGAPTEAQWISLGTGLLTEHGGGPVSIEIFATLWSINFFSRIFEFGASNWEYLLMTWSYESDANSDLVRWWDETKVSVLASNAPYELGQEYHIVVTVDPGAGTDGTMLITWYSAPSDAADIGPAAGFLETPDPLTRLGDVDCWIGKSHEISDPVANASYNDVRIWAGALTEEDIAFLHRAGPDM